MNKESYYQKSNKQQHFIAVFQAAIKNLENFTLQNEASAIPHVFDLDVKNQTVIARSRFYLRKIFYLVSHLLESIFFRKRLAKQEKKRLRVQEEILRSVVIVKKHYQILDKLKNGSEEQRHLATLAHNVIERYNALINQSKSSPPSIGGNLVKFFYDRLGVTIDEELKKNTIDLPRLATLQIASEKKVSQILPTSAASASMKVAALATTLNVKKLDFPLTQNETDAFCMKALTMIKSHAVPVASIGEALNFLKSNPIETSVSSLEKNGSSEAIVSLSQVLNLFPGEVIELYGSFKRNSDSSVLSVPIADSFQIFSKSIQKGFPHPSQYHGSALTDKLIPACPLRLDQLPHFQEMSQRKNEVAEELLPKGKLIRRARELLKLKKQTFDKEASLFLSLHRKLAIAILDTYGNKDSHKIDDYFRLLEKQPSSFDAHSKTGQLINEYFIERPYGKLEEAWLECLDERFHDKNVKERFAASEEVLSQELSESMLEVASLGDQASSDFEKIKFEYALLMGSVISEPVMEMILQQQSEKIEYAPPMISDLCHRMQTWLYKQLFSFHLEFDYKLETTEGMKAHLLQMLESDIVLFSSEEYEDLQIRSLINELEDYYNSRFTNLK